MEKGQQWERGDQAGIAYGCEQTLVADAQMGCADAFTQLISRYEGQVVRYLARRTGDRELAADLAQQTFLDAFRHLDRLHDDRPFAAWLFRIAHYNLLHELRRQRIRRGVSLEWLVDQAGETHSALHSRDKTARTNERSAIRHTLDQLSSTVREPLLLHAIYGYTSEEIAEMLGVAPAAVRQRLARAKAKFRRLYDAAHSDQEKQSVSTA